MRTPSLANSLFFAYFPLSECFGDNIADTHLPYVFLLDTIIVSESCGPGHVHARAKKLTPHTRVTACMLENQNLRSATYTFFVFFLMFPSLLSMPVIENTFCLVSVFVIIMYRVAP